MLLFLCALNCFYNAWGGILCGSGSTTALGSLLIAVACCRKTSASLFWLMSWTGFSFLRGIEKQSLGAKSMLGFLDLVIWQTFSQDSMKLACCFKENDLPILLPVIKLRFLAKITILVNRCPSLGAWAAFLDLRAFLMRWIK